MKTKIKSQDILPVSDYILVRQDKIKALREPKKLRRVFVGPFATFYFENYDTMWLQVQEMLRIEKGGNDQLLEELEAYNPLIPSGDELVATLMLEIDNPVLRDTQLRRIGDIENCIFMNVGDNRIKANPELDQQRTDDDGRTSSVHFLHFEFDSKHKELFKRNELNISVQIEHPSYEHKTNLETKVIDELAKDFI